MSTLEETPKTRCDFLATGTGLATLVTLEWGDPGARPGRSGFQVSSGWKPVVLTTCAQ